MEQKELFESLLEKHRVVIERYINFRMPSSFDADDVIGETYYAAYLNFSKLKNIELFKPWMLSIARNQCNLWYRKNRGNDTVPLETISDITRADDYNLDDSASSLLKTMPFEYAEIIRLTMQGFKQSEIAERLGIPTGTVKSRLHYARKQFRSACTPEQIIIFEKGRKNMAKKDYTCGFHAKMPEVTIKESARPFFEVKFAEDSFIIPVIGNKNTEGTYRYPDKSLTCVSTCYVPKAAYVHGVQGVKVCRDTYNVRADKMYKNEAIWFSQLTDEYVRDLASIACDSDADDDYPTYIDTFLCEDFDIAVNGGDRIHGRPLLVRENPPKTDGDKIIVDEYNVKYTMGVYDVTIGERTFETIKIIIPSASCGVVTEDYVDRNGRLVMMRWYESAESIELNDNYSDEYVAKTECNPTIVVNDMEYRLIEDRISEYALFS